MIYGLAIAGGLVLILLFLALRERMEGGERMQPRNTGDGGVPASYTGAGGGDTSSSSYDPPSNYNIGGDPGQCDSRDSEPKAEECAVDENSWDDGSDCASDGGSDGGGSDGGGGGGD
jgi:hypothetical protein